MDKAYLILADGTVFEGESIGFDGESIGEVVFTTTMGGFVETITDHRFFGQMVVQTFPIVGSYGFVHSDSDSIFKPSLKGYIVRELCQEGSNFRMDGSLNDYLVKNEIVGIQGIDTRALTRKLRDKGSMNGMITKSIKELESKLERIKEYKVICPFFENSIESIIKKDGNLSVAVWDFGFSDGLIRLLKKEDISVVKYQGIDAAEAILNGGFDGVILSDGGGNYTQNESVILQVKKLVDSGVKMLGIGLGHILMAAANGLSIKYLKRGHRGSNHPVKALKRNMSFVAGHNHGYTVAIPKGKTDDFEVSFVSLNDNSCEGLDYKNKNQKSVQFDVDSKGARFVLDEFVKSIISGN